MRVQSLCLTAAIAVAAVSCGDDGGGKGGSGVPAAKKVNDLSASELAKLCKNVQAKFADLATALVKVQCTAIAITSTQDCSEQRSECIAMTRPEDAFDEDVDCNEPTDMIDEGCDATVGEFEACVNAAVRAVEDVSDKFTCNSSAGDLQDAANLKEPDACARLDTACGLGDLFEEE